MPLTEGPVRLDTRIPRHTEILAQVFVVLRSHLITQDRTRHAHERGEFDFVL